MAASFGALFLLASGVTSDGVVHPDAVAKNAQSHKSKAASLVSQAVVVAHAADASSVEMARRELRAAHKASKVWCGGMFADGCASCPQGNGESWCHGECAWSDGQCSANGATTTASAPRPSPTTTEGPRPALPNVQTAPVVAKVLAQHSQSTTSKAAPESNVAAAPEASLRTVKFTPPATMKLDPQWAAHLAAAPQAISPQAAASQASPPQDASAHAATSGAGKPSVNFEFAVPQAVAPQTTTSQAPTPKAVAPPPLLSATQPVNAWGASAAEALAPVAVAVKGVAPQKASPLAIAPPTSAPEAKAPEMVKHTVQLAPTAAPHDPQPMVHTAAATSAPTSGHFLAGQKKEDECACAFHGDCTCEASMAFMECISSSCADGCECHDMQYHDACVQLSDACTPVGLSFTCDKERAVCLDNSHPTAAPASTQSPAFQRSVTYGVKPLPEIQPPSDLDPITALYHSLNELKEDKCALELALSHGFVNADSHLSGVQLQIEDNMGKLTGKCLKLPELHCEKDFEEWSNPPPPCGEDEKDESSSLFEGAPGSNGNPAAVASLLTLVATAFSTAIAIEC